MAKTPDELLAYLDGLGIRTSTKHHPPLRTVSDSRALRGAIDGAHTKNLFLKDKKGAYFLITADEGAELDLKSIHGQIGASGRVTFGKAEALMELLGVAPGAVTAFGLINDTDLKVKMVLDAQLMSNEIVNCHPLTNEATTSIATADLMRFIRSTGHEPVVLNVSVGSPH